MQLVLLYDTYFIILRGMCAVKISEDPEAAAKESVAAQLLEAEAAARRAEAESAKAKAGVGLYKLNPVDP
jgi:hypothetical protein